MRFVLALCLICKASATEITVAAASDLIRVGPALTAQFAKLTGQQVRFTYGSSGLLARQIENGAPFDLFLSANQRFISDGVRAGYLATGSERTYAAGRIALWSASRQFRSLAELKSPAILHIAIANPAHAPYGEAALEALKKAGVWPSLKDRLVYGENVRQTLQFAESGNADVAIVAWSLVFDRGGTLLPESLHGEIRQVAAMVKSTRQSREALRFLQFLGSAEAQAILVRHGFGSPTKH